MKRGALRLIVTNVKDHANLMLDPKATIVTWNEGAEKIKGYRAEEILGRHFSRFYSAADIANGFPRWIDGGRQERKFRKEGWRLAKTALSFLCQCRDHSVTGQGRTVARI